MSQNTLKVHDLNEDAEFDENGVEVFDEKALVELEPSDNDLAEEELLSQGATQRVLDATQLYINVPDLPLDQIKGIRVTRCGTRHPADQVIPQQDPRGNTLYWIGPPGGKCDAGPGTDFAAVDEGYVSITPLHVDLTAHSAQDVVSDWLNSVGVGTQW